MNDRVTELTHVSKSLTPIVVRAFDAPQDNFKPRGFWYEVNADWRRWARREAPMWLASRFLHRVERGEEHMLIIANNETMDEFTTANAIGTGLRSISWSKIAQAYDGIEIAPYLWSRRNFHAWYYPWDCASGCVWRPRGVTVTPIGPVAAYADDEDTQSVSP